MKQLLYVSLLILVFASCKKEKTQLLTKEAGLPESFAFSFGVSHGFCVGECAKFYSITNEQIFPDDMQRLQKPLLFKTTALSNEKYLVAKSLLDSFPAFLINNPDTTIGCPDCHDQGAIYLEAKGDGVVKTWNIDTDENKQPAEIKAYIQQLLTVLNQL